MRNLIELNLLYVFLFKHHLLLISPGNAGIISVGSFLGVVNAALQLLLLLADLVFGDEAPLALATLGLVLAHVHL